MNHKTPLSQLSGTDGQYFTLAEGDVMRIGEAHLEILNVKGKQHIRIRIAHPYHWCVMVRNDIVITDAEWDAIKVK